MQTKKIHFGAFSRFKPYLLRYPKEIIGALILGILSGFSTVLMTYYIGKSVDTMVGKGQVNLCATHQNFRFISRDFTRNRSKSMADSTSR